MAEGGEECRGPTWLPPLVPVPKLELASGTSGSIAPWKAMRSEWEVSREVSGRSTLAKLKPPDVVPLLLPPRLGGEQPKHLKPPDAGHPHHRIPFPNCWGKKATKKQPLCHQRLVHLNFPPFSPDFFLFVSQSSVHNSKQIFSSRAVRKSVQTLGLL